MHARSLLVLSTAILTAAGAAFAQDASKAAPTSTTDPAKTASANLIQALKKQTAIRSYQWTETMVVSVEGKEKSTVVNTCNYNEAGGVSRTPVKTAAHASADAPGTRSEIDSYVNSAVGVMRGYVRPDPAKLQACQDAARVSLKVEEGGKHQTLQYRNFLKPGDTLSLVVDPSTNQILSLSASTFVINANDRAEIHTEMSQLPDGISYPSRIKFDTPGRQMGLVATDSDYRKKTN